MQFWEKYFFPSFLFFKKIKNAKHIFSNLFVEKKKNKNAKKNFRLFFFCKKLQNYVFAVFFFLNKCKNIFPYPLCFLKDIKRQTHCLHCFLPRNTKGIFVAVSFQEMKHTKISFAVLFLSQQNCEKDMYFLLLCSETETVFLHVNIICNCFLVIVLFWQCIFSQT